MKNKKTLPIMVGILVIAITVVVGVSYAVWQLTKTQTGTNIVNWFFRKFPEIIKGRIQMFCFYF